MDDIFRDRVDAGHRLACALTKFKSKRPLILCIPRGGVAVGKEVAKALMGDLNVIVPRKIGAPNDPEFAIGAVMEDGTLYLNKDIVERLDLSKEYIEEEKKRQLEVIRRRIESYRKILPPPDIKNRITILVDDGLATGATARAALLTLSLKSPERLILAVPVAPLTRLEELEREGIANEITCILKPTIFWAISQFYEDFSQVEDTEVEDMLREFTK